MELQNFEKSMHQKFQDFQPEVNDLKIWDGIESQIPKQKKRRPIFWLFWIGLPTILFCSFYFIINYCPSANNNYLQTIEGENLQNSSSIKISINEEGNDLKSGNNEALEIGKVKKEVLKGDKKITHESSNIDLKQKPKVAYANAKNINNNLEVTGSQIVQKSDLSKLTVNNDLIYTKQEVKDNIVLKKEIGFNSDKEIFGKKSPIKSNSQRKAKMNFSILPIISSYTKVTSSASLVGPHLDQRIFDPKNSLREFKTYKFLGIQLGYAKMFINHQSNNPDLLNIRKATETPLDQINLSLYYKLKFSNRISLLTGLNLWQATWHSIYSSSSEEVLSLNFQQITRTREVTYKKYGVDRALSIPLQLGFDFVQRPSFHANVGIGYEFNLIGSHKGYEFDLNGQEYFIDDDIENRFQDKSGNYLLLQLGLGYNLNKHTLLNINFGYKHGLNAFQTQASLSKKTYKFLGLNAGISKCLN